MCNCCYHAVQHCDSAQTRLVLALVRPCNSSWTRHLLRHACHWHFTRVRLGDICCIQSTQMGYRVMVAKKFSEWWLRSLVRPSSQAQRHLFHSPGTAAGGSFVAALPSV
jgi:hypothetical protein